MNLSCLLSVGLILSVGAQIELTPIKTVDKIFNAYIKSDESPDTKSIKVEMEKALNSLQESCEDKDLPLLINVWMYYTPTDFHTRELITSIFMKINQQQ